MRLKVPVRIYAESNRYSEMSKYASRWNGTDSGWVMCVESVRAPLWYIAKAVPHTKEFPNEDPIFLIKLCGSKPMSI